MRPTVIAWPFLLVLVSYAWPQQPTVQPDPALDALSELRCMRVLTTLQVTRDQASGIIETLADLSKQHTAYAQWAAERWASTGEHVQAALSAWTRGQQPDPQHATAAFALMDEYVRHRTALEEAVVSAATALLNKLQPAREIAETRDAALARQTAERRFGGARNAAEFILSAAESLRLLMPDDYQLVRSSEAHRLASALAGTPTTPPSQLVAAVLATLDDLMNVPPQTFVDRRDQVLHEIARRFSLDLAQVVTPQVTWEDLLACLRSPQVFQVLYTMAAKPPPAVAVIPPGFETAMARLAIVSFVRDMQLSPEQSAALSSLLAEIQRHVANHDKALRQQGAAALTLLPKVREAIAAGQPLDAQTADALQAVFNGEAAADEDLKLAMVDYIARLRRILGPDQRASVDWIPPGDVMRLVPPERRAEDLRDQAAMIADALRFINSVKYTVSKEYRNKKVQFSLDYLSRFFRQGTPPFDRALQFTLDLLGEARFVEREEWESGVDVQYATTLLQGLGLLGEGGPREPTGQELHNWQSLYELLTKAAQPSLPTAEGGREE